MNLFYLCECTMATFGQIALQLFSVNIEDILFDDFAERYGDLLPNTAIKHMHMPDENNNKKGTLERAM